jgi:hypothetical protein
VFGAFSREQHVYAELANSLPVRLPRCYHLGNAGPREADSCSKTWEA